MELGRELFQQWGYKRVDELVWVKTSQLGRLIRTGRTGHWLKYVNLLRFLPPLLKPSPASAVKKRDRELINSHTCEHLLVALKIPAAHPATAPIPWDTHPSLKSLRKGIDTDVVVAEVRETSRKPDEVYGVIER